MRAGVRLKRRFGLDRNPLRRFSDRVEAGVALAVVGMFLLIGPFAGWRTGHAVYQAGVHAEQSQRAHRVITQAVLLAAAGPSVSTSASTPQVWAPAQWTDSSGRTHNGDLSVVPGSPAGTVVPIWTTQSGELAEAPQPHDQSLMRALGAAGITVAAIALALMLLATAIRRALDRRRLAAWDRAWADAAPKWTPQR